MPLAGRKQSFLSGIDLYPGVHLLVLKICVCSHFVMKNLKPTENSKDLDAITNSLLQGSHRIPIRPPVPSIYLLLLRQPHNFKEKKEEKKAEHKIIPKP